MNRTTSALIVLASVGLAACGSSSSSSTTVKPTSAVTTTVEPAAPTTTVKATPTTKKEEPTPTTKKEEPTTTVKGTSTTTGSAASASEVVDVKTVGTLGEVLVDGDGRTLYLSTKDTVGEPGACVGTCAATWPADIVAKAPKAGGGVDADKLSTVKLADGKLQVTYDGHPLYRYAKDTAAGEAKGQKVDGTWFAVDAAGVAVDK